MTAAQKPVPTRDWFGLRVDDPPAYRHDFAGIYACAAKMLNTRVTQYPRLIADGTLDRGEANREIAAWQEIVRDWRWLARAGGNPASADSYDARCEALDDSLRRLTKLAQKNDGLTDEQADMAHFVIAMRWHLLPDQNTHQRAARCMEIEQEIRRQIERELA